MSRDPANLIREHVVQVTAQRLAVRRAVSRRSPGTDIVAANVRAELGAISRQAVHAVGDGTPTKQP